jgi:protein-disulfide isomerase
MYQLLYAWQDSIGRISYHAFARRAAVPDLVRFDHCMAETAPVARIERDFKAARDAKIPGTPGVIIDGTLMVERPVSVSDLEQLLTAARRSRQ